MNLARVLGLLTALVFSLASTAFAEDAKPAKKQAAAVIRLVHGDFAEGALTDSPPGAPLAWKSPALVEPLRFPLAAVQSIRFPVPERPQPADGDLCIELANEDRLIGRLLALDGETASIEVASIGRLNVRRDALRRLYRWNKSDLLVSDPGALDGWRARPDIEAWREDGESLVTDTEGASIRRDFQAPPLARWEFDLSWTSRGDFELALGVDPNARWAPRAFHIEVWGDDLVAVRETEKDSDFTGIQELSRGAGRLSLQVFLDQKQGRMIVFSALGHRLADLTVPSAKQSSGGGLLLTNRRGDVRLEGLRIGQWDGILPQDIETNRPRVAACDGAIVYGEIQRYDDGQFVVSDGAAESRIDAAKVQDVYFGGSSQATKPMLRAALFCGIRLSGDMVRVGNDRLWLRSREIDEEFSIPLDAVQMIAFCEHDAPLPAAKGRQGRLETEGMSLHGSLAEGDEEHAGTLAWRPVQGDGENHLARGLAGRIVYREPAPPPKPQPSPYQAAPAVRRLAVDQAVLNRLRGQASGDKASGSKSNQPAQALHLRSGDTIECTVTGIDEKGVRFTTPLSDATFVAHDQIKTLELMPHVAPTKIAKSKKERLLTLPRMQRDSPPTQLIRSVDGDYLRGRLVEMNDQHLQVEVRLETKTLPRSTVARIIWLHADEMQSAEPRAAADDSSSATRVQAIPSEGNRLTFVAERLEGTTLSGHSDVLGGCHVDLEKVDQLLIGGAIEQAAATLAFHQWRLKPAAEPLAADQDAMPGEEGGEGSALVGKPAPDFQLELLDGKWFRLEEQKGKIVVLDFWASWCGPCLQTMPQVDKVAREYADRKVMLVAVNLEERPERIRAALDRLQLSMPVALDVDGRVAEKYGATAIPQTVVVDPQGKVARLFVGGGARFDEQLRAALEAVVSQPSEQNR